MEIIDKTNEKPAPGAAERTRYIYLGVALIVVGAVWMLHNFDLIAYRVFDVFFSWQTLLIVIGGYLLSLRRWVIGGMAVAVGAVFLLTDVLNICIPLDKVVWPSIFIVAGLAVLLTKIYKHGN
jgi:hypothetical protein